MQKWNFNSIFSQEISGLLNSQWKNVLLLDPYSILAIFFLAWADVTPLKLYSYFANCRKIF